MRIESKRFLIPMSLMQLINQQLKKIFITVFYAYMLESMYYADLFHNGIW